MGWAQACTETGYTSEDQCSLVTAGRKIGDVSAEDGFRALIDRVDDADCYGLLRWFAQFMFWAVPDGVRMDVLRVLAADPPIAALLYVWCSDLNESEADLLRSFFYPHMSVMREKDLAGDLRRARSSA